MLRYDMGTKDERKQNIYNLFVELSKYAVFRLRRGIVHIIWKYCMAILAGTQTASDKHVLYILKSQTCTILLKIVKTLSLQ